LEWQAFNTLAIELFVGEASPMSVGRQLGPEWVLAAFFSTRGHPREEIAELLEAARRLWPSIQAHAYKERSGKSREDALALATEVWEGVLESVAKSLQRAGGKRPAIQDLDAYLFGAFHHRFNRALRRERRTREPLEELPSNDDLGGLPHVHSSEAQRILEQQIQVKEAMEKMDDWTRKVWAARRYGYSWREIADHFRLTEPQVKLRFRYAITKLRTRFTRRK
jgi:RNA polymerase sigma factor (sigma-70 family)